MTSDEENEKVASPTIYESGLLYDLIYGGDTHKEDKALMFIEWFLEEFDIKPQEDNKILDMGAGTGRLLIPLTTRGYSITGFEPFEGMRKWAAEKAESENSNLRRLFPVTQSRE